jgi:hypothetical protein
MKSAPVTTKKIELHFYRCESNSKFSMQTLAATSRDASRSFGCRGCEQKLVCSGPVPREDKSESKPAKKNTKEKKNMEKPKKEKAFGSFKEAMEAIAKKSGEERAQPEPVKDEPSFRLPPGINAETDAIIRQELAALASYPASRVPRPTIAPQLIEAYGGEMRAIREKGHSWRKIARVFRAHRLKIGERSLKVRLER